MPQIILKPKHFLTGLASSPYIENGLFDDSITKGIDVFRSKATYGLLQQGYKGTDLTGTVIKDTIKWFVQKGIDYYGTRRRWSL